MIVQIQYCVYGTSDVNKSKWAAYVAPNHLPFKNFSIEFMQVSCFYLGYFKTWCTLQVCTFFKVFQLVHHVLKYPFLFLKSLWFLGCNICSAYELFAVINTVKTIE